MFPRKERDIFVHEFADGRKLRRDPLRVLHRLEGNRPSDWKEIVARVWPDPQSGAPEPDNATRYRLMDGVMDRVMAYFAGAFDVKQFAEDEEKGLLETELMDLHNAFMLFLQKKSDDTAAGPSSSPGTPAPTPSAGGSPLTDASSDCGCGDT